MQNASVSEPTEIAPALHEIADRIQRRGLVVLISDLMDEPEKILHGLKHFRHAGHEVLVFHTLDHQELSMDFDGDVLFEDMETKDKISTQPWHIRQAYQKEIENFTRTYQYGCREQNIDYFLLNTKMPFDKALMEYLIKRGKLG